ncbi:hypothetical protein GCK72_008026 [Caenorhabditis remanei]|uniref:F-box associated domain-containing protein n=1 Tax=Caenorhabditis remanei TaxID=31234 RepID=A0A6A5HKK8_CAERE|nr:hypothetical protein GCK72_008026 [Caenorhabditis remanei]KAF1768065.1 hypothetical protein GCK72_008026 [Caenorhabditis remanei]
MVSQSSLPLNFIVRINELGCCFSNIDRFPINIDPSSFPLKSLRTVIREPDYLNHPILTSAKILIVVDGIDRVIQLVNQNNTNKRVKFEMSSFRIEDLLSLVRCWKDNSKEIGTTFKFRDYTNNQSVMYFLLQELKEFKIESDHHSSILRVPINRTADIHISHDNGDYIVVEVVPSTLKKESNATEEPCCSKRARHS